jgi:hypothetical protein
LKDHPLDIGIQTEMLMLDLFDKAQSSMRKCVCEGRAQTVGDIMQCKDCAHTACARCAGRPDHNYAPYATGATQRVSPHAFMNTFASVLPMCVVLGGFTEEDLEAIKPEEVKPSLWKKWVCIYFIFCCLSVFCVFIYNEQ